MKRWKKKKLYYFFIPQTDDKGVFGTTLSEEFELVAIHFGLTQQNLKDLCLSAVQYAFITEEKKSQLSHKIELFYNSNWK